MKTVRIAVWNANGLAQHCREIINFLHDEKIDIMLISETHFIEKSFFKVQNYEIYDTKHPDGTAHGGTGNNNKKKYTTFLEIEFTCKPHLYWFTTASVH